MYKYEYDNRASIIAAYIPAYLCKKYRDKILYIFEPFHQEKVINCKQVKDKCIDLVNKNFINNFQQHLIEWDLNEEEKPRKKVQFIKDNINSFKTTNFYPNTLPTPKTSSSISTWDSKRSLMQD